MSSKFNYNKDRINAMEYIDGYQTGYYSLMYPSLDSLSSSTVKLTIKDNKLVIYPTNVKSDDDFSIIKINLDDIEYFTVEGEKYYEQKITGGGSTGIQYGGAALGYLIAGDAGMVLGGQRKVNDIKSSTVKHDNRKVKLSYFVNKKRCALYFMLTDLEFFQDNMPDKDYSVVSENKKNKYIKKDEISSKDKLKELKDMLDNDLITKEEYEKKKNKILDEM